jgi:hypothetical protein
VPLYAERLSQVLQSAGRQCDVLEQSRPTGL